MSAYSEAANGFVVSDRVTLMLDMLDDESRMRVLNQAYKLARSMKVAPLADDKENKAALIISACAIDIRQSFRKRQKQSQSARQVGAARAAEIVRTSHDNRETTAERREEKGSPTPPIKEESKDNIIKPPISPKRDVFVPPTVEAVSEYCKSRNNGIDAQSFIDFYESKGWMIGKNKMKDWQAAVRTWEGSRRNGARTETGRRAVGAYGSGATRTLTAGNFRGGTEAQRAEAASVL